MKLNLTKQEKELFDKFRKMLNEAVVETELEEPKENKLEDFTFDFVSELINQPLEEEPVVTPQKPLTVEDVLNMPFEKEKFRQWLKDKGYTEMTTFSYVRGVIGYFNGNHNRTYTSNFNKYLEMLELSTPYKTYSKKYDSICKVCRTKFKSSKKNAKFCSNKCKTKFHHKKQALKQQLKLLEEGII